MSEAFACDICETFEHGRPVADVTFSLPTPVAAASGSSARTTVKDDLCAKCLASLQDWRTRFKVDPKEPRPEFGKKGAGQ